MEIILIIAISFAIIFIISFIVRSCLFFSDIKRSFSSCNVIVFGKKGTGKDLIFQKVINSRKKAYCSNVDYGGKFTFVSPSALELKNNTYDNFIKGEINIEDKPPYEGVDFYFSDAGIILPSQYDTSLYKKYPSFPITYALSRHLFNNNIHVNTQNLSRIWKALREQADFYVCCVKTIKLPFFILTKCKTYDNYDSALKLLNPMPSHFLSHGDAKARREEFEATYGRISSGWVIQRTNHIKYDTREFHKIIFGKPFFTQKVTKTLFTPLQNLYNRARALLSSRAQKRRERKNEKKN